MIESCLRQHRHQRKMLSIQSNKRKTVNQHQITSDRFNLALRCHRVSQVICTRARAEIFLSSDAGFEFDLRQPPLLPFRTQNAYEMYAPADLRVQNARVTKTEGETRGAGEQGEFFIVWYVERHYVTEYRNARAAERDCVSVQVRE